MFIMQKIIKQYGNTSVIVLNSDDLKILELKTGDIVDIIIRKHREEFK